MFVRRKRNRSGSVSVQVLKKEGGRNKLVKTVGCAAKDCEIVLLEKRARKLIKDLNPQITFDYYSTNQDKLICEFLNSPEKPQVTSVGPDLVLGAIFDQIGFNEVQESLFKDIVISRLVYPTSKLKTTEYLLYHKNQDVEVTRIYRFLDRFHKNLKPIVEELAYAYTKRVVGKISIVFYDMTTLYFEAEDEDDLRKIGFSKDGKFQKPQIMLGLLVAENGYPIGYDIFEGNTFEGKTLIPTIKKIQSKYKFQKPIIVADSALLSRANIQSLEAQKYSFIIGARIRNESEVMQSKILEHAQNLADGDCIAIDKDNGLKLVIGYSEKRALKDAKNREKGVKRLEQRVRSGRLTKKSINNRGYNKFLVLESEVKISIDRDKIIDDAKWDGLKGYVTNSDLSPEQVVCNYRHLWQIEKAFRISKTDLRIRPIFHRRRDRIDAHICIAFVAYTIFKELERRLLEAKTGISPQKAIEMLKTIYQIEFCLPDSQESVKTFARLSKDQEKLLEITRFG